MSRLADRVTYGSGGSGVGRLRPTTRFARIPNQQALAPVQRMRKFSSDQLGVIAARLRTVRFGACPPANSTAADVVVKWGSGAFIRTFLGFPGTVPTKEVGASGAHFSWSFGITTANGDKNHTDAENLAIKNASIASNTATYNKIMAGDYNAAMILCIKNLDPNYFFVEAIHEADTKYKSGTITMAQLTGIKNWFYDLVKANNPNLRVVVTLTGYSFSDANPDYTKGVTDSLYGVLKGNVIGLDVDGIHATAGNGYTYPQMQTRAKNAQKWIIDHATMGYTDYAFPEWGTSVIAKPDDQPDLIILSDQWITYYGESWVLEPKQPLFACWYDYGSDPENATSTATDLLLKPNPIAALRALVALSIYAPA